MEETSSKQSLSFANKVGFITACLLALMAAARFLILEPIINRPVVPIPVDPNVPVIQTSLADRFPDDFARSQCSGLFNDLAIMVEKNTVLANTQELRDVVDTSIVSCQDSNESFGWNVGDDVKVALDAVTKESVSLTEDLRSKFAVTFRSIADRIVQ